MFKSYITLYIILVLSLFFKLFFNLSNDIPIIFHSLYFSVSSISFFTFLFSSLFVYYVFVRFEIDAWCLSSEVYGNVVP